MSLKYFNNNINMPADYYFGDAASLGGNYDNNDGYDTSSSTSSSSDEVFDMVGGGRRKKVGRPKTKGKKIDRGKVAIGHFLVQMRHEGKKIHGKKGIKSKTTGKEERHRKKGNGKKVQRKGKIGKATPKKGYK